jgi:hypothetical protein
MLCVLLGQFQSHQPAISHTLGARSMVLATSEYPRGLDRTSEPGLCCVCMAGCISVNREHTHTHTHTPSLHPSMAK